MLAAFMAGRRKSFAADSGFASLQYEPLIRSVKLRWQGSVSTN
jgi:hypothetical protein